MEGKTVKQKRTWPKLLDLIFSWSLQDVLNHNLYTDKVEKIPESFQSVEHYLRSYVYPLLEETRAELAASLEVIDKAPFAEVAFIKKAISTDISIYSVMVDHWKNRSSDHREPYITLPGDIVLISDAKPETSADLLRMDWNWTFASIVMPRQENVNSGSCTDFTVKVAKDIGFNSSTEKLLYVVFLEHVMPNSRIWNALGMKRNLKLIEKVLCNTYEVDDDECELCSVNTNVRSAPEYECSLLSMLNESQSNAILSSLGRMKCDHQCSVELLWGPPGTGKTRTISVMLFNLVKMKRRTLTCAPTNVAVTEVALQLCKQVTESFKKQSEMANFFCPLGDILLYGHKDRLKSGQDIEEIQIHNRIDRLVECLGSTTGWRQCITSMISFLENCVAKYQNFVSELITEQRLNSQCEAWRQQSKLPSYIDFARSQFKSLASSLRECFCILCTHVARHFIQERNFKKMQQLFFLLESLEVLLFQENTGSLELEKLLLHQEISMVTSDTFLDVSSLVNLMRQCLILLEDLSLCLGELRFPSSLDEHSITEFCLRTASIIFCTPSLSYKFHLFDLGPFDLLVIDEAAQLRECESIIPFQLPGLAHLVLVGDECQLPATVISKVSQEAGFGRSLFERLSSLGHSKHLLNIQYRMHPSISQFPNSTFYLKQIKDALDVQCETYEQRYLPGKLFGTYSFINVPWGKEDLDDVARSQRNLVEVALVVMILKKVFKAWSVSRKELTLGIISPYAAQVMAIQDKLAGKYEHVDGFQIKVKTVDGFQGGEEDVIIVSTVRSNRSKSIGFLSSLQRTNVALTRARHCLWILGNEQTLVQSNSVWQTLIHDAKDRKCFCQSDEDTDMWKTILDVKQKLDQLNDFLDGNSMLFKSRRWKVVIGDEFRKSFRKLTSSQLKRSTIDLLFKVAGGWRPKRRISGSVCESSSQIVKQFKVEKHYVLCTTDIQKESSGYTQVLKVWDIVPAQEIAKSLKRIDKTYALYTNELISLCKGQSLEGNLEVPKSWALDDTLFHCGNKRSITEIYRKS